MDRQRLITWLGTLVLMGAFFTAHAEPTGNDQASNDRAPVVDIQQDPQDETWQANSQAQQDGSQVTPSETRQRPMSTRTMSLQDRVGILDREVANLANMNLSSHIDQLQEQLQQLRGELETEQHALQQLAAQQKTFYQDLDHRITQLQQHRSPVSAESRTGTTATALANGLANQTQATIPATIKEEQQAYTVVFAKLSQKRYEQATDGFKQFLRRYPNGRYAVNAHYWLGEVYSMQGHTDQARQEFNLVIQQYPESSKVPDAMLKLAFIEDGTGLQGEAKKRLEKLIKQFPKSAAAHLAGLRLQEMQQRALSG